MCEKHNLTPRMLLGVKSARISDFGGKSLNVSEDHASLYPNIDHKDVAPLKQWAASADLDSLTCLTNRP